MSLTAVATLAGLLLAGEATPPKQLYTISGRVTHPREKTPIRDALVVLQCTCLERTRETETNDAGLYRFKNLTSGTYTIQVLIGTADVSKVVTLGP